MMKVGLYCLLQEFVNFLIIVAILDAEEFGEASETVTYDENSANPAVELGLMVGNLTIKDQIVLLV